MSDNPQPADSVQFEASFPCDVRFVPIVRELGQKLALSLGYGDDDAADIGRQIDQAFEKAAAARDGRQSPAGDVCVSIRAVGTAFDATVRCPLGTLLELSRSRP